MALSNTSCWVQKLSFGFIATSLLLLAGCKSTPQSDYDTNYDFNQLKSYSHLVLEEATDTISAERIKQAIDTQLQAQGFKLKQGDSDFLVSYRFITQEKPKSSGMSIGLGTGTSGRHGSIGIGTSIPVGEEMVTEQSIQIDVVDSKTNRLIWRGSDKFDFDKGGEAKLESTNATVANILSVFPPQKVSN
ncbi:DUF4136 domain-containing protein [Shewanella sp. WXL01]|uniref:DUF4136 domain-containing protein n=1 Tax=Shewanella sp. WXL01 TaxID=2709721 RepID=UPI0014386016|nr:DUF4136 domain-containing protein [Shewanella sp. WXL01]NKF49655.1 DUF4136 domain-containing protein [Shewanella sp. WXL01]